MKMRRIKTGRINHHVKELEKMIEATHRTFGDMACFAFVGGGDFESPWYRRKRLQEEHVRFFKRYYDKDYIFPITLSDPHNFGRKKFMEVSMSYDGKTARLNVEDFLYQVRKRIPKNKIQKEDLKEAERTYDPDVKDKNCQRFAQELALEIGRIVLYKNKIYYPKEGREFLAG